MTDSELSKFELQITSGRASISKVELNTNVPNRLYPPDAFAIF